MNGIKLFRKGITCVLMAPTESLNIFENDIIVMNAGTAHGNRKITPKIRLPLMNGWLAITAVNTPKTICNDVAQSVQIIVQDNTDVNVSRHVLIVNIFRECSKPFAFNY